MNCIKTHKDSSKNVKSQISKTVMTLPKDPFMLYSMINMKLRDEFPDLKSLCANIGIEEEELCSILGNAGFRYDPSSNQFR